MLISKNAANPVALGDYEKRSGYKFPDDYARFLSKYNGGYTPNTTINTSGLSTDVKEFFGVGNDVSKSLEALQMIDKNGSIYLPVAEDSFGNIFVLDLTQNTGIYFVDHEKDGTMQLLTESFAAFIKLCKSEPIKESSKRTPKEREKLLVSRGKGGNISDGLRKAWQEEYDKFKNMIQEEVIL